MDKKYIKSVMIYVLSGILALVGIGYIVYHMLGGNITEVKTEVAMLTEAEDSITAQAVIMRSEIVVDGVGSDICGVVQDGKNVHQGEDILWIFYGDGSVGEQIRQIEKEIDILEDSLMGKDIPSGLDTTVKDLQQLYTQMLASVAQGRLEGIGETTVELQTLINRKKKSASTEEAIQKSIEELVARRTALMKANSAGISTLTAPDSGLFYSYTDGYEMLCTMERAKYLTVSDYVSVKEQILSGNSSNDGICKIVTDMYWYVCLTVDNTVARNLVQGDAYKVQFHENDGIILNMTLDRLVTEYGEEQSLLVFGCRTIPNEFDFKRIQNVSVVTSNYSGFRVPANAVRYVDGKVGVYVTDGNKVRFRRIDILFAKDGNYIVKQYDTTEEAYADMLRLYDKIILAGKELYDGKYLS
ncbi:MAG: hypothetical protein E7616_00530 [Ruminococcaceae bacterium]|nr:hypothetical protein [Oscillospiraceae bacterium]